MYAHDPQALRSASIELEEHWFTDTGPGGGTDSLDLKFDTQGLHTTLIKKVNGSVNDEKSTFTLADTPGRARIASTLDALRRAGWWRLVDPPKSKNGPVFFAGNDYSLHIRVSGTLGDADLTARLPHELQIGNRFQPATAAFKSSMTSLSSGN